GAGPGSLPSDAWMMGIDPLQQRDMMEESLEAIMALLADEKPVDRQTGWFTLRDARLQLRPYTRPHFEVAVAATLTPAGPRADRRLRHVPTAGPRLGRPARHLAVLRAVRQPGDAGDAGLGPDARRIPGLGRRQPGRAHGPRRRRDHAGHPEARRRAAVKVKAAV